jgi:1-acyl-sn-glycerol-3-phosphate acyltransferase
MPRPVITFAADYLRASPIMNWFLSDLGHAIYLRRGEGDHEALERGLEVLRAGGAVGLGPEGTRSRQGGLGPGRTGAAWLALRADVPVIPLAAWGQEQLGGHWRSLRRAPVRVRVGDPLRFPAGEPTARRLQEHTDEIMRALARLLPPDYRGVYA